MLINLSTIYLFLYACTCMYAHLSALLGETHSLANPVPPAGHSGTVWGKFGRHYAVFAASESFMISKNVLSQNFYDCPYFLS